jgi:hypothetical protein
VIKPLRLALAAWLVLQSGPVPVLAAFSDSDSVTLRVTPTDIYPPVPVTDLAGSAGAEGQALLQWSAPEESAGVLPKNVPPVSYVLKTASFSAVELGGDTTAWFNAASVLAAPPPLNPGSAQSTLTSLEGGTTWYFGLRSIDDAALVSDTDSQLKGVATQVAVPVKGIRNVTDLTAASGPASGDITLSWTTPNRLGHADPVYYDIRASSLAQIGNDNEFDAALPLTAFSASAPPPPVGAPGAQTQITVTGLLPAATYWFAIRAYDQGGFANHWIQNPVFNPNNWAPANYVFAQPQPITDLAATAAGLGTVRLRWTAPRNLNLVPIAGYTVKYSSQSIAALGGNTTAWFNLANSTVIAVSPAQAPGSAEELIIPGFSDNEFIFFAIKSTDVFGVASPIDSNAYGVSTQARIIFIDSPIPITAVPGTDSGSVSLTWSEPALGGFTLPVSYRIHASTAANLDNIPQFEAAQPLSAFSSSPIPVPTGGLPPVNMVVTGLKPGTTYYFGIRLIDSNLPTPVQTNWVRSSTVNAANFAPAHYIPRAPDAITDLTGLPGAAEGDVTLSWTAPRNQNFVPMESYQVRAASFPVTALGGDTTAWFNLAPVAASLAPANGPGVLEALTVAGLEPNTTYWFSIRGLSERGEAGLIDTRSYGLQVFVKPTNLPPGPPSNLTALPGLRRAFLSWTDVPALLKGLDFEGFRLYRSTEESTGFAPVSTTTALALTNRPLTAQTSYWFKLSAYDRGGNESVQTSTVSVLPFTIAPMEPIGMRVSATSSTVTFGWSPVRRFSDSTLFDDPGAPVDDELIGYSVRRSTSICEPVFTWLSSATVSQSSFTDTHNGSAFYYQLKSYNTQGFSTSTLVLSSLGDYSYFADDCASAITLDDSQAASLRAADNGLGADIQIRRRVREEDASQGGVLQSVEFRAMLDGATELPAFHFSKPARIKLRYGTGYGGFSLQAGPVSDHVGMYWHNGAEFKKLYGSVDPFSKEVAVETPNIGLFQLRTLFRQNSAVFDVSNLSSRVITPNGDGLNDILIFTYDPGPNNILPTGAIHDMRGAYVAPMLPGLVPNTLTWDGKMNGRVVTSGVYVYQIKGDGKTFNGTIVIAR